MNGVEAEKASLRISVVAESGTIPKSASSDSNGRYEIRGLPPEKRHIDCKSLSATDVSLRATSPSLLRRMA